MPIAFIFLIKWILRSPGLRSITGSFSLGVLDISHLCQLLWELHVPGGQRRIGSCRSSRLVTAQSQSQSQNAARLALAD